MKLEAGTKGKKRIITASKLTFHEMDREHDGGIRNFTSFPWNLLPLSY
jgi:hypothetical protein